MNWSRLKNSFRIIDPVGLDKDTVLNLRLLVAAVAGGTVWGNITGGIAITGYLKALGASDFLYGILISLSPLMNAFQFLVSWYMERTHKRRRIFLISGFIQRTIWIPFALIPYLIPLSQPMLRLVAASVLVLVSAGMAPFMNVSYNSLCDDVIPMRIRGRYFASRSKVATIIGLIIGILTGVLLDAVPGLAAYTVVFLLASVFGIADICTYLWMHMPDMRSSKESGALGPMLWRVLKDKNYMRVVRFVTVWLFAVYLASPYFNVYMKETSAIGLGMTNFQMTMFGQIASNVGLLLLISRWGRALDTYGSKPVLRLAGLLVCFTPLIWLFTRAGMPWIVGVAQVWSGMIYCAIDLGNQNLFMSQASAENKSMYFAIYAMFTQLFGIALGSAVGGWLLDNVLCHTEQMGIVIGGWSPGRYHWLFVISALLRLITVLVFLPSIREEGAGTTREVVSGARTEFYRRLAQIRIYHIRKRYIRKNKGER